MFSTRASRINQFLVANLYSSEANIVRREKKVRVTLDIAEGLLQEIDRIRNKIGVDRAALIKIWLHERVQKEKSISFDS